MQPVSIDRLLELREQCRLNVDPEEAGEIRRRVNGKVESLESLYEIPVFADPDGIENRSWSEVGGEDDPNNAIVTECHVSAEAADGLLAGYEVGIKDNIAVAGVPMTCASPVFRGLIPQEDAIVVERLLESGATITAKANCDELGSLGQGTTAYGGPITNPHDSDHLAGGSSGGSAAAVATGRVDVALGTDTGGSVRIPACQCGVVGLKPTHGLAPLTGFLENAFVLDTVGPIARTVADVARTLESIAGKDGADPATLRAAGRDDYRVGGYVDAVEEPTPISELTIGVLEAGFQGATETAVADRIHESLEQLEDAGATLRPVGVPHFEYSGTITGTISALSAATAWQTGTVPYTRGRSPSQRQLMSEFARRIEASGYAVNDYVRTKLLFGSLLLEEDHGDYFYRAIAAADLLTEEFEAALSEVDVVACPTMTTPAPTPEEFPEYIVDFDYSQNTTSANLTRNPAISIPAGTVDGLPVGLQLLGGTFEEAALLGAAASVESVVSPE